MRSKLLLIFDYIPVTNQSAGIQRDPVMFWQMLSFILCVILIVKEI